MKNKKYGFTLVEVILTIALIGIVTPVIYSLFFSGQKSFKLGTEEVYEQQDHRLLRDYLTKELRYASYISNGKPNEDPDKLEYEKYYSLELEDAKIVRKKHEKSNDWSDDNPRTLASFKWEKIDIRRSDNFLTVKYKDADDNEKEEFTIFLENNILTAEDSSITRSNTLYYAMYGDAQNLVDDSGSESGTENYDEYNENKTYNEGDIVLYKGKKYKSRKDDPNQPPPNPGHWEEIK